LPAESDFGLKRISGLKNIRITVHYVRKISSTQDYARTLLAHGAPEGTLVVSEAQEAGRGRMGRKWFSPEGGLWMSMILLPRMKASESTLISLLAAMAAAESIRQLYSVEANIKWPNDVEIGGKKVGGTLVEAGFRGSTMTYAILGIGINLNLKGFADELQTKATSLQEILGKPVNRESFLSALLAKFDLLYGMLLHGDSARLIPRAKSLMPMIGRRIGISTAGKKSRGVAMNLGSDGALVVRLSSGALAKLYAGEVSVTEEYAQRNAPSTLK
jgi:BirA family biotin operon repressor/biotin-[acetyl-CoA-carboxylase] ligase